MSRMERARGRRNTYRASSRKEALTDGYGQGEHRSKQTGQLVEQSTNLVE